jgi:hypothetical protein
MPVTSTRTSILSPRFSEVLWGSQQAQNHKVTTCQGCGEPFGLRLLARLFFLIGLVTPTTKAHLVFIYSNEQNATAVDSMRETARELYPLISIWNSVDIDNAARFLRNVQSPSCCVQCLDLRPMNTEIRCWTHLSILNHFPPRSVCACSLNPFWTNLTNFMKVASYCGSHESLLSHPLYTAPNNLCSMASVTTTEKRNVCKASIPLSSLHIINA